jgi:hypothetical protein
MEKVTDQVACHILIRVKPEEHLRLKCIILTEPQRNCTDSRDLSPVAPDWRNGRVCPFLGPSLGRDWDVAVR